MSPFAGGFYMDVIVKMQ